MTTTTVAERMTKRDYFNLLAETFPTDHPKADAVQEFIAHELELLERKNSAVKKPTATQVANASIKDDIVAYMEPGTWYTASDLLKLVPSLDGYQVQKSSALARQLVLEGKLVKGEDKRKPVFALAE